MKVLNLRRPAIIGAALFTAFALAAPAQAQVANPNLIPAKSAYIISVPDAKALWSAWKTNAIYDSYKKLMQDPEFAAKMESFNKELKTIEDVLQFKLDGETLSTIFKNAAIYIGPGENAGSHSVGAILQVADKDKLDKLMTLAEKAATEAVADNDSDSDKSKADSDKSKTDSSSTGENNSEEKEPAKKARPAGKAKPADKAKPAKSPEGDSQGGADDTETTSADSAKKTDSPISKETYAGVTVKRFATGEENEVYYAVSGDLLLLSNDRGEMKALVDRAKASGQNATALGSAENYKKVVAALKDRPGEAYLFGNQKEAIEMQQGGGMDALREITQQLSPVEFYGSSVKIEPKQITHYSYGVLPSDTSSSLLSKHPGDKPLQAIRYVPSDTLFAFGTSLLDSEMLYKLFTDAADSTGNKSLEDQMKTAELMLGFSVKNDLIPALGNEMGLGINSVKIGGSTPNVDAAIILSVRDKEKMKKVLDGLQKLATSAMASQASSSSEPETTPNQGGADDEDKKTTSKKSSTSTKEPAAGFKELKVGDATIHYVDSATLYGMTPGYVLDGDFLVIGSTKEAMQNAMEVKSGNKSIADSEAVKALGPRITTTGNMFQYLNFSGIWSTADVIAKTFLNPTLAKGFDAVKVLKTAAGVSSVKNGAVVSEGVLLLQ